MEFSVLGPLEVRADGESLELAGARTRAVLAMLLVHANQVVSSDRLVEELWPGHPIGKAADSLQVRLSELRKALRSAGEADRLATRPPGYVLRVTPGELDARRFEKLAAAGNVALAAGDAVTAASRLDEALSLWRGSALADMEAVPSVRVEAGRLEEERLAALESRAEALLACGRHRELIGELETLTTAHPLRERFWSHRMLALYRAGRQADALRAYRELRDILVDELAIEPGPELRELHARILSQDPGLDRPTGVATEARAGGPVPQTRYAQTADGIHIAYQVIGEGDQDIVFVPGLMSHLELLWEDHQTSDFFRRLSGMGRLIMFDKRDTGLSDRAPGDMSLEQRMEDLRAVMHAAGSRRAVLFGYSEGAPMSILYAAANPRRVAALILGSASARWFPAPGYPCGQGTEEMFAALTDIATHRWGQGASIEWYMPSRAGSDRAREMFGRFELGREPDRVLATILRANTTRVPEDLVRGHRGRLIRTGADGILATFDAPGQAIRCAAAVRDDAAAAGIGIRAGIHTGEVDLVGEDIAGLPVQITDKVAALAGPKEILVSRTVKDLVTGSGITFAERGSYVLSRPPDELPLFAVTGFAAKSPAAED